LRRRRAVPAGLLRAAICRSLAMTRAAHNDGRSLAMTRAIHGLYGCESRAH
jgi:hypothetical protein